MSTSDSTGRDLFGEPLPATDTKRCRLCQQILPKTDFYQLRRPKTGKTYLQSDCKKCQTKSALAYFKTPKGTEVKRNRERRLRYGMTLAQYQAMHDAQGGVCAICGRPETRRNPRGEIRPLSVDHEHDPGDVRHATKPNAVVRGLLCSDCNAGLGHFKDDTGLLRKALEYLLNHSLKQGK
jgi:hypothetical protein